MDRRKLGAEVLGTFWLVLGGCGAAVLAPAPTWASAPSASASPSASPCSRAPTPSGHVSGAHFNPAITLGLVAGKRFPAADAPAYIAAQVIGALPAAGVLFVIASGIDSFDVDRRLRRQRLRRPVARWVQPARRASCARWS